jgi:phosphoribosylanthranilate isomerase
MIADLPIDALGFILVPGRRRTVSLEKVGEMLSHLPRQIPSVGVLQNPTFEEVEKAIETGLSMIQLHGAESPDFCQGIKEKFDIPIIKVFTECQLSTILSYKGMIDIVLLDHSGGGVGLPINWKQIPHAREFAVQLGVPLWIAGGLNEANIQGLCSQYAIDGIDLSSGIEVDGKKNEAKMRKIVERMEQYGRAVK